MRSFEALVDGLQDASGDPNVYHRAVLLLARAGATAGARREYERLGLNEVRDHEDIIALGGRLLKDLAFAATGETRRRYARESAAKYAEAYALKRGYYPGINTATMSLIAGDRSRAAEIARAVLQGLAGNPSASSDDTYFRAATKAEANFLVGRVDEAEDALASAIACDPTNYTAHASTLRQLEILCAALRLDRGWLDRHRPPPALMFCGHLFEHGAATAELAAKIEKTMSQIKPGAVFGALAAGSDILIAEAGLTRGAEFHVVLPMREEDFIRRSVTAFGEPWRARYEACKSKAATFRLASGEPDIGDDAIFAFGAEFAMGLAIRHAEVLSTRAEQLAIWDGGPGQGIAGTSTDVARWQVTRRPQTIIPFARAPQNNGAAKKINERTLKAMLFCDVRGFSKLEESDIRPFVSNVLSPIAAALRGSDPQPELIATWGDGIHMVYDSVGAAADAALAAQERFAALDLPAAGLPPHLALRIGGHFGPVAALPDPFLNTPSFYGTHITIAARIEPVTVPGSIYVSEPFAALLALRAPGRFRSEYVGQTELPKGFGAMRLFALRRAEVLE